MRDSDYPDPYREDPPECPECGRLEEDCVCPEEVLLTLAQNLAFIAHVFSPSKDDGGGPCTS